MPKFFVDVKQIEDNKINIVGEDVKHITKVLRYKEGDNIDISDGKGFEYACTISNIEDEIIQVEIKDKKESETEADVKVTIYQALPKSDKMEYIIQKAVELGVYKIVPVATKNCVVKISDKKKEAKKIERWNKISEAAAKQSGRGIIPEITPILTYKEAIKEASKDDVKIVLYENEKKLTIREIFDITKACQSISVFIGPEGGYTEEEIQDAIDLDIKSVTLGKRILRTETVSSVILSIIMYNMGEI